MHSPTKQKQQQQKMLKLNTNFMIFQHVQKMCQGYDAVGDKKERKKEKKVSGIEKKEQCECSSSLYVICIILYF